MYIIKNILFLALLAWLAYGDYKYYKIPNKNILYGLVIGIVSMLFVYGIKGIRLSLLGGVTFLIIGYIFWKIKIFRAGDAKFLCLIGIFEGFDDMWMTISIAIIVSGIIATVMMVKDRSLKERLTKIGVYFKFLFVSKKFFGYWSDENDRIKMPFATTCFIGILIYKLCLAINYLL